MLLISDFCFLEGITHLGGINLHANSLEKILAFIQKTSLCLCLKVARTGNAQALKKNQM